MVAGLANNSQILRMLDERAIVIDPFVPEHLKTAHYGLTPLGVFIRLNTKRWVRAHNFDADGKYFLLEPDQYVIVEPREQIILAQGILGKFIPPSNLIDQCIGLTAGRVEYPFGQNRETLRFGLRNLSHVTTRLRHDDFVAYIEFHDLRDEPVQPVKLTPREDDIYARRRRMTRQEHADADGVFYDTAEDDTEE